MTSKGANSTKAKGHLTVHLELPFDSYSPSVTGLNPRMKVSSLMTRIEQDVGILPEMCNLTYLDAAPLENDKSLLAHDIVNGATLKLCPWRIWYDLLKAAYLGDTKECFSCSMEISGDSKWSRHCAWCTLYVAAHRGHYSLVAKLLETTFVAINTQSPCGWTGLHAAARTGQWKALCILVDSGADVTIADNEGLTAFDLARKYSNKKCEQSLNFCQWNLQKHRIVQEREDDYDARKARTNATRQAHQYRDSTLTTWLKGTHGQKYVVLTPNPVNMREVAKFEQKRLLRANTASKRDEKITLPSLKSTFPSLTTATATPHPLWSVTSTDTSSEKEERREQLDFNYGWFDPLRAQQLIPSTHDVLTYANPSSCQLRPRSVLNPDGYKASVSDKAGTASVKSKTIDKKSSLKA